MLIIFLISMVIILKEQLTGLTIGGAALIIAGIVVMFEDILVGLGILVCGIACFGYGLFVQHANKWKAYMLHYTVHGKK